MKRNLFVTFFCAVFYFIGTSSAKAAECQGPYHVLTSSSKCAWSCAEGTTPDQMSGECACEDGYEETGKDDFGRRVCELKAAECQDPYHVLTSDSKCAWSCAEGTTPDQESEECACEDGYEETGKDDFGRRICGLAENSLNISTADIKPLGGNLIKLNGLTFDDNLYDVILQINLDGTWIVPITTQQESLSADLNFATGQISGIGSNGIRFRDLEFSGQRFDATIDINLDGTWSIRDLVERLKTFNRSISGVTGSFVPNAAEVLEAVTIRNYLYLITDNGGNRSLETWDIRNPNHSMQLDSKTLVGDYSEFPALSKADDTLLLAHRGKMTAYGIDPLSGIPSIIPPVTSDFAISVNAQDPIKAAGGIVLMTDADNQPVFVNYTNAARPILLRWKGEDGSDFHGPISLAGETVYGSFHDDPAVLAIQDDMSISFLTYNRRIETHLDSFWRDKLRLVFNPDIIDITLEAQLRGVVEGLDLGDLAQSLINGYSQSIDIDETMNLDGLLRDKYQDNVRLDDVFEEFGIEPSDSLRLALEKILNKKITAEIEAGLSTALFRPAIEAWLRNIFGLPDEFSDWIGMVQRIEDAINADPNFANISSYLVRQLLEPLLKEYGEVPEAFFYTLDELIVSITANEVTEVIDGLLQTTSELNDIILQPGDYLENFFSDFLTDASAHVGYRIPSMPHTPTCSLPRTSADMLRNVFYDYLELDGTELAWIELIKYYQEKSGNSNYKNFVEDIEEDLRSAHKALAVSIAGALNPVFELAKSVTELENQLDGYLGTFSSRTLISRMIAVRFENVLEENGIDPNMSIGGILESYGIYVEVNFAADVDQASTLGDLRLVLNDSINLSGADHGLGLLQLSELLGGASFEKDILRANLMEVLKKQVFHHMGVENLNLDMELVLKNFLGRHIDLASTLSSVVQKIVGGILGSDYNYSQDIETIIPFYSIIDRFKHVIDHPNDCYNAWRLVIEVNQAIEYAKAEAKAAMENPDAIADYIAAEFLEVANQALEKAYRFSIDYALDAVMLEMGQQIFGEFVGSFDSTLTHLTSNRQLNFNLGTYTELNLESAYGHIMSDKLVFVLRESMRSYAPGKVTALVLDPENLQLRPKERDLGLWGQIDYVHETDGIIMIGGQRAINNGLIGPAVSFIDTRAPVPLVYMVDGNFRLASAENMLLTEDGSRLILQSPDAGGIFILSLNE